MDHGRQTAIVHRLPAIMMRDKLREIDAHLHRRAPAFWRFLKYRFKRGEAYGLGLTIAFFLVAASLWLFLWIEDSITNERAVYHLDFWIQEVMAGLLSPGRTRLVLYLTHLGGTRGLTIMVTLLSLVLIFRRRWWSFFGLVFATAGGGLVLTGLKLLFRRARPVEQIVDVVGYAFPSGHAFGSTVFFGYVIYLTWTLVRSRFWRLILTAACLLLILLIGTSRVYLNVHWLTDVLGGFTAGFIWLVASILIVRLAEQRHVRRRRIGM